MDQEKYVKGCSMKRPPFLEPNGVFFWKSYFETYVKSKDIDLWQVIQNDDFYYELKDSETKLTKETPYELLEDDQKKKLGKENEAKMTLYNALPHKEYERVFMCKTAKEVWHTLIIVHQGNSQVKNCNIVLLTQEYEKISILNKENIYSGAKVTTIKDAKDLATLPLDEVICNLKVYEMGLDNDSVVDSQRESDEDIEEEEAEAIDLVMIPIGLKRAMEIALVNKSFVEGAWSDSKDGDEHQNDATSLMAIDSQEVYLRFDLLLDDWIMDSGFTKHITENRRLFTLCKAYDGGHVVFRSNLKGKVVGGGNITHDSITITNVEHTSGRVSNDSSDGIAAIINKLDSLGKDIKKLKENVHDIHVECEYCGGAYLNKECPLNEEVKSVKEVKYGEFRRPFPNNNGNDARYYAIFTKEGLPLYTPFYYSPEEIEYFFAKSSFSDEEETKELKEIKEVAAQHETIHQKVTLSNLPVVRYYIAPYKPPILFPRCPEQHFKEALVHKAMESLKKIKVNRLFLKEIWKIDDYAKHIKNLAENKSRTSENEDVKMNTRCSTIL
nr:hypothetical protein [Tanacetum cinerariifolium]